MLGLAPSFIKAHQSTPTSLDLGRPYAALKFNCYHFMLSYLWLTVSHDAACGPGVERTKSKFPSHLFICFCSVTACVNSKQALVENPYVARNDYLYQNSRQWDTIDICRC